MTTKKTAKPAPPAEKPTGQPPRPFTAAALADEKTRALIDALAAPFPEDCLGWLPKGVAKGQPRINCGICGGYHRPAAVHVPYVPHAYVRERLNLVAPGWSWRVAKPDEVPGGEPIIVKDGLPVALWIVLEIPGLPPTVGVGGIDDPEDKAEKGQWGDLWKILISDAIPNAAMTRGVALYLWQDKVAKRPGNFRTDDDQKRPASSGGANGAPAAELPDHDLMCRKCGGVFLRDEVTKTMTSKFDQARDGVMKGDPILKCPACDAWVPVIEAPKETAPEEAGDVLPFEGSGSPSGGGS